jgi:hypothetical protein
MPGHTQADRVPGRLTIATCQFPVDADIKKNRAYVLRQMRRAAGRGADIVHFPECALSGYAGSDMDDLSNLDWDLLRRATLDVMAAATAAGVWVPDRRPHRRARESPAAIPRRTPPADVGRRWPESDGDKIPATAGEGYKFHLVVEVREVDGCGLHVA